MRTLVAVSICSCLVARLVSAQSPADTLAVAAAAGAMLAPARPSPALALRPGRLGRAADSAFAAGLRSSGLDSLATVADSLPWSTLGLRLERLEWRGQDGSRVDRAVVRIESELCNAIVRTGMNWSRNYRDYLFARDTVSGWRFVHPEIVSFLDGTCAGARPRDRHSDSSAAR